MYPTAAYGCLSPAVLNKHFWNQQCLWQSGGTYRMQSRKGRLSRTIPLWTGHPGSLYTQPITTLHLIQSEKDLLKPLRHPIVSPSYRKSYHLWILFTNLILPCVLSNLKPKEGAKHGERHRSLSMVNIFSACTLETPLLLLWSYFV